LIDLETLEVKYSNQIVQLKSHDAVGVHFDCLHAFENKISFAPEANLLHIQLSGPTESTGGSSRPAYLAKGQCCLVPARMRIRASTASADKQKERNTTFLGHDTCLN
jgi:hypothetical protein